jgi:hypothetical protein
LVAPVSAQTPTSPAPSPTPAAGSDSCPGYTVCPIIDFQDAIANDPGVRQTNAGITRIETQTLNEILTGKYSTDPTAPNNAKSILGEVMIYDRSIRAPTRSREIAYNSVLTVEQTYQKARRALVQEPTARLSESTALFQALGGGWWNREDVTAAARIVSASNSPE